MKDFFISYNKADLAWAEWIAWQLDAARYTVVVQAWDFRPGSNFVVDMDDAAEEAERTIAVLSPDYLTSGFGKSEWAAAFAQDPTGKESKLLPVRVRECELKGLLSQIVYIDLLNLNKAAAKRALLNGVKSDRAIPDEEPDFPGDTPSATASEPRFPGAMPAILCIPHLRNRNFTGREDELAALRASLNAGEAAALVQARAISGLGGVGKTQLAIEYVYRYASDYDYVWWIRSENPVTLARDYALLAVELDLPEKDATEQHVAVEAVKKWLRRNRRWLLIFDNAEDAKLVREYIPSGGIGHIIITSRNPNWAGVAKPLSVRPLPIAEAIEFLVKRTGGGQDEATVKALAEALGCLPLALEQASAFIETSGRTLVRYLELFENHQKELMQRSELSTEYPATVATTWSISFQNVERDNPPAAELLRLCAFFAPDDIPLNMITDGAGELPESLAATVIDSFLFDEALIALRKYSLVEVEDEKLSIHRLVQAVIRHAMYEEDVKRWTGVAVHLVNASFPEESYDVRTWPLCATLLPHASVALSHAEAIQFTSNKTARLLNQIGLYLYARAEYTQAKIMHERALAIDEATLSSDHPTVAVRLNNLGNVLKAQGDLAGAKALYERALAIGEATFGPDHLHVATYTNNLGNVLREQGDFAGAKPLLERALAIDETTRGPDHPDVAIDLNNLGNVLKFQGDLDGAKALYKRALAIDEAALGPHHTQVALFANNLGNVLQEQGDFAGAKSLLERSLQIFREFLGDEHPLTKLVQNNLRLLEEDMENAGQ
ncbi:MAG TPA: FxSxx-COOH system tetratricopeptide repeat protein [Blastocatellia bacterium]|nr:FxSxx-COOH system tetratricopeptide repeat protein [Blastocatellia bacterium]